MILTFLIFRCSVLMIGSSVTLVITVKFLSHLPEWTLINVDDEVRICLDFFYNTNSHFVHL